MSKYHNYKLKYILNISKIGFNLIFSYILIQPFYIKREIKINIYVIVMSTFFLYSEVSFYSELISESFHILHKSQIKTRNYLKMLQT